MDNLFDPDQFARRIRVRIALRGISQADCAAETGISMSEIAQYLGHSDDRITQRVYAKYSPSALKKAASVLDLDFDLVAGEGVPSGTREPITVNRKRT